MTPNLSISWTSAEIEFETGFTDHLVDGVDNSRDVVIGGGEGAPS
jgi:hypothetical protein